MVRPLVRMVKDLPDYVSKTRQTGGDDADGVLRAMKEARQPDLIALCRPARCLRIPGVRGIGQARPNTGRRVLPPTAVRFAELQHAYPHLPSGYQAADPRASARRADLAKARRQIDHDSGSFSTSPWTRN